MPLNKTLVQYLTTKLKSAHAAAVREYTDSHPTRLTNEEVKTLLEQAGFAVICDGRWIASYVQPATPNKVYAENEGKIAAFKKASQKALDDAIDAVNLGDTEEALAMLRNFTAKLQELAR